MFDLLALLYSHTADCEYLPAESTRTYIDMDSDWLFSRGDFPAGAMPAFDDSGWRKLNLPHDWSIEGPFDASLGSATGYAPGGIAWYRKHFKLDAAHKGNAVAVEFDGIYNNSEVWINGQFVGRRPYGYSSFQCDLTPYLKFGKEENILAVRVDHTRLPDSRWYTGSGIYRHVRLRINDKLHIGHWGVFVSAPQIKEDIATATASKPRSRTIPAIKRVSRCYRRSSGLKAAS